MWDVQLVPCLYALSFVVHEDSCKTQGKVKASAYRNVVSAHSSFLAPMRLPASASTFPTTTIIAQVTYKYLLPAM